MVFFGQIVVGPPGSGKTTYCHGMQQMCNALGRKCVLVNLDPANDEIPYQCDIDVRSLVSVEDVMEEHTLGPNGALMYCMEYLLANFDWLSEKVKSETDKGHLYVIFDCPGQVELYTHQTAMLSIIRSLQKELEARLTAVHLMDSILCTEATKYISGLLTSLSCQLLLELPHVNALTKIDLLKHHSRALAFRLEYYAEVQDLQYLLDAINTSTLTPHHPFERKYIKLQEEVCRLVEDFNLAAFLPLDINAKDMVLRVLRQVDLANGFSLSGAFDDPAGLFKVAVGPSLGLNEETFGDLQEHYIDCPSSPSAASD